MDTEDTPQDTPQDAEQVVRNKIVEYCMEPHRKSDIANYCGYKDERYFTKKYLKPLLEEEIIAMTIPDKPNSKNQKYVTVKKNPCV